MNVKLERQQVRNRPVFLPEVHQGIGFWSWFLQRLSGVALVFYLFLHIWVIHFSTRGRITFDSVMERLHTPFFITLDLLLLGTVIFHALNGIRVVLIDLGLPTTKHKLLFWVLILIGIVLFIYGFFGLLPFILE